MKPEIESLAQQLIAAAEKAKKATNTACWLDFNYLATPANITAVILAFREELKQARRNALEEASQSIRDSFGLSQDEYARLVLSLGNRALVEKP